MYIGTDQLPNYVVYATNMNQQQKQNIIVNNNNIEMINIHDDHHRSRHTVPLQINSGKPRFRVVTNIAPPFVI
ncbi:hypothetical protein BLA29_013173 [Euroglyphus maynei]|uniref:Uncharacterized protein n=1 Tax=Euroglyphus maynei TaxID=6958 RepID=A0A1Y3BGW8_EURMA|nr:hypothetical protein BLA29_013173 [Euroglyphus maynei]